MREILMTNEMFGLVAADDAVMAGKNYIMPRKAMGNIAGSENRISLSESLFTSQTLYQ